MSFSRESALSTLKEAEERIKGPMWRLKMFFFKAFLSFAIGFSGALFWCWLKNGT